MRSLSTGAAAVAVLPLVLCSDAWAGSTTWSFAGVVQSGVDAGQLVSGAVTFDLSAIPVSSTNGQSHAAGGSFYFAPHTSPPQLSALVTIGAKTVEIGGGSIFDVASVAVDKADFRYPAESYYDGYYVQASSLSEGGANPYLSLSTFQYTDGVSPSGIFTNTHYGSPDLGLEQSVNWLSPGATSFGSVQSSTGEYWSFSMTSMSVTAVPEPRTFLLLAMGLAGLLAWHRRRRGVEPDRG